MSVFFHKLVKSRSVLLFITVIFSINMTVSAAMVSTIQTMNSNSVDRSLVTTIEPGLNRIELAQKLINFGVAPEQVHSRLNSMTDAEVVALSSDISELPAGGEVLAVLAVVFFVLLFTDIAGYTDLFPFVKKTSRNSGSSTAGTVTDRKGTQKRKEPIVVEN